MHKVRHSIYNPIYNAKAIKRKVYTMIKKQTAKAKGIKTIDNNANGGRGILPWHQTAFTKLEKMIAQNHLPHALLITGVIQMGKFELAISLIKTLIKNGDCIDADNVRDDLDVAVLYRRSHYENLIYCRGGEINKKTKKISKKIRIDQVRGFCEALNKTANDLQIGLLFYADDMSANAANSLLKTLEEPRDNTLIILLAHNAKNLPATIISRCQSVHIAPAYDTQTKTWLERQVSTEQNDDFDMAQLLENTHGVPFKVLLELSGDGFIHYQNWQNQLLNIAIHPTMINQLQDIEGNEVAWLGCLQNLVIEGIRLKSLSRVGGLVELNKIVQLVKIDFLFHLLDDICHAINLAKTPVNIKLLLDNILIVWSHITHLKNYPKITKQI